MAIIVRPIADASELDVVYRLHHDSWVAEGLLDPQPSGRLVRHPEMDADPNTIVLIAVDDGKIIGTNTLTLDGPLGVPMDHGLREEVDRIRAEGNKLMASWRIATDPMCRNRMDVVLQLIEATAKHGVEFGGTVCIYLFAKRHERVYQKIVSATTICDAGIFYSDAPKWHAVLMRTDATRWGDRGSQGLVDQLRRQ